MTEVFEEPKLYVHYFHEHSERWYHCVEGAHLAPRTSASPRPIGPWGPVKAMGILNALKDRHTNVSYRLSTELLDAAGQHLSAWDTAKYSPRGGI